MLCKVLLRCIRQSTLMWYVNVSFGQKGRLVKKGGQKGRMLKLLTKGPFWLIWLFTIGLSKIMPIQWLAYATMMWPLMPPTIFPSILPFNTLKQRSSNNFFYLTINSLLWREGYFPRIWVYSAIKLGLVLTINKINIQTRQNYWTIVELQQSCVVVCRPTKTMKLLII